mmetsp:Transcript_3050/g.8279  ORF Transcript_3050/g.8279 Transcript_3050/m.8279 type:complete len:288 (-) Transcript_3050:202-1065(-)
MSMPIVSNTNILNLLNALLMMQICSFSIAVDAEGLGYLRKQQERSLKYGNYKASKNHKASKNVGPWYRTADTSSITMNSSENGGYWSGKAPESSENVGHWLRKGSKNGGYWSGVVPTYSTTQPPQPATIHPLSIEAFAAKCPYQSNALDGCILGSGGGDDGILLCKTCVVAVAHFSSPTIQNLNSCSDPNVNGGWCGGCYEDAASYYNCGTGSYFGNVDFETSGGVQTATPVSPPRIAPKSFCPTSTPVSGESCDTGDYDYLECYYPNLKCTCRHDHPFYLCVDYSP